MSETHTLKNLEHEITVELGDDDKIWVKLGAEWFTPTGWDDVCRFVNKHLEHLEAIQNREVVT